LKLTESKGHLATPSCKAAYKQNLCIGVGRLSFREALQGVPQETTSHSEVFTDVWNHQEKKKKRKKEKEKWSLTMILKEMEIFWERLC